MSEGKNPIVDLGYELTASECSSCKKAVLVAAGEREPHCYFCGRRVPQGSVEAFTNINAAMQRLTSFVRESKIFDKRNTNTVLARLTWEVLGKYLADALAMNEASIRFGYYGKPHEFDEKMLQRTRAFLDEMEKAYAAARTEIDGASKRAPSAPE